MTKPGWWCAFVFVTLGCGLVPYIGVQTDEALFGAAVYQQTGVMEGFRAFGHHIPTMSMSYLGALKTWLYAPIFALWPPSPWSIRVPMLLLGGCTLLLFARFMERLFGRTAAWVATALLATDASLVMTTAFDWGPVAIQHFLQLAAAYLLWRYHHTETPWRLALAAFLLGLALWNKAIFAWTLAGAGVALLCLYPREFARHLRWRKLALATFFFAAGASMLIRYNVRHPGHTFRSNAKVAWANISDKHIHVRSMLDGSGLYGYTIAEDNYGTTRFTYGPWLIGAVAVAALASRRRAALFPLVAGIGTWLMMATTADAGGSIHHTVLLYPFFHWMLAAVVALIPERLPWRAVVAVVAALLVLDNMRVLTAYRDNAIRLGGGRDWSEAVFALVRQVKQRNPQEVRLYDWGMQDNLILLSARPWPISYPQRPFTEAAFTEAPNALWLGHVKSRIEGINEELFRAAETHGYERVVLDRLTNRLGTPIYETFLFRKKTR
jgi:4-amino-4-deoxy-L-arabinose transferase-like glycosyltransferase